MVMVKPGDHVTCRVPEVAYGSGWNPHVFRPGMVGTVYAITPKICMPKRGIELPPGLDRKPDFIVVDYTDSDAVEHRVGLNFCNCERVTP